MFATYHKQREQKVSGFSLKMAIDGGYKGFSKRRLAIGDWSRGIAD